MGAQAVNAGWRAYLVVGVAALAYIVTILQRTSFGVAGIQAADRYQIDGGTLSAFVFLQLVVYVLALIPAGFLVDRFGSRRMLILNAALLSTGQIILAFASTLPEVVAARVIVGCGDALIFASVLALVPRWFPPRRVPLVSQLAAVGGQFGQVLSAVPFAAVLRNSGWTTAFLSAAGVSVLTLVLIVAAVHNAPAGKWAPSAGIAPRHVLRQLREVWGRPGTRVGFFGHMGTQFSMMSFSLLWGVPYLVKGQHLTPAAAGGLISVFVVACVAGGPLMATFTARCPQHRTSLVFGVIGLQVAVWTVVLVQPGPAPRWLLVILVLALATGGPGSMVAIDIGRTSNPLENSGLAQSIVNLGGFLATLAVLLSVGLVVSISGAFAPAAFRVGWSSQYLFWAIAAGALLVARRTSRRRTDSHDKQPHPAAGALLAAR